MYTKQEISRIRSEFWTTFGQYMKPVLNAEGETINWTNYKTGVRHIFFRMDADNKGASIRIELKEPDTIKQREQFDLFQQFKGLLEESTGEKWDWRLHITDDEGRMVSVIGFELKSVNVFRKEDWPSIISFLKPRIVALDRFWNNVRDMFLS